MTNEEYVQQRDALIPEAEQYANARAQYRGDGALDSAWWNRCFMEHMDTLARAAGLVTGPMREEKRPLIDTA